MSTKVKVNTRKKSNKSITKDTKGAGFPQFKPKMEISGGLSHGVLAEVVVGKSEIKSTSNMQEFVGLTVPNLTFVFKSLDATNPKHYFRTFKTVPASSNYEFLWDSLSQTVKHFAEVHSIATRGIGLTDAEYEEYLVMYEHNGEPEDIIEVYQILFDGIATLFNGDGKEFKGILKDKDAKSIELYLKLIRYSGKKGGEVNAGNVGMATYPGEGLIEVAVKGQAPLISINLAKGESIEERVPVTPTPNAMGATGAVGAAPNPSAGDNGAPAGGAKPTPW